LSSWCSPKTQVPWGQAWSDMSSVLGKSMQDSTKEPPNGGQ
jgi:hypothetical protein